MINATLLVPTNLTVPAAAIGSSDLLSLERQCVGAMEILKRLSSQKGLVLADDAGMGKTWTAALAALTVAGNGGTVLILVPNRGLLSKWIKDFGKVAAAMPDMRAVRVRAQQRVPESGRWQVGKLVPRSITIATHHSYGMSSFPAHRASLLIVDEAHRSKNDEGVFKKMLMKRTALFDGVVFLTATPFSIQLSELESMLNFIAGEVDAKRTAAFKDFSRLIKCASNSVAPCEMSLADAIGVWETAVDALKPWVMRHTIDGLPPEQQATFGKYILVDIPVPHADQAAIELLIRTDRLMALVGNADGLRGNDPRFHVGRDYLSKLLAKKVDKSWPEILKNRHALLNEKIRAEVPLAPFHAHWVRNYMRKHTEHPKIAAVAKHIVDQVKTNEKVLVFCHHLATAHELHRVLKGYAILRDKAAVMRRSSKAFGVWKTAWSTILAPVRKRDDNEELFKSTLAFVCDSPFRTQVTAWLDRRVDQQDLVTLITALTKTRVRHFGARAVRVPAIAQAVLDLAQWELHDVGGESRKSIPHVLRKHYWHPTMISDSDELEVGLALFNTPFGPDVLIATDKLSEGMDLHRCCRILVHYELDPSPVRVRQREGRVRRIGSWAATIDRPVEYSYPAYRRTRDEFLVRIIKSRLDNFDLLLGGAPNVTEFDVMDAAHPDATLLARLKAALGSRSENPLNGY